MQDSEKPDDAPRPRSTLKLKSPVKRSAPQAPSPPPPPAAPRSQTRNQEAASWADEHKHRMQADMDALSAGHAPPANRQRRR